MHVARSEVLRFERAGAIHDHAVTPVCRRRAELGLARKMRSERDAARADGARGRRERRHQARDECEFFHRYLLIKKRSRSFTARRSFSESAVAVESEA